MSYDVYFVAEVDGHDIEIAERNYTSNVSAMWTKALALPERPALNEDGTQRVAYAKNETTGAWNVPTPVYDRGVRLLANAPASECAGLLAAAVERMAATPDEYRPLEPGNGWGDYEGALDFLRWMAETASEYPSSWIRVSS